MFCLFVGHACKIDIQAHKKTELLFIQMTYECTATCHQTAVDYGI